MSKKFDVLYFRHYCLWPFPWPIGKCRWNLLLQNEWNIFELLLQRADILYQENDNLTTYKFAGFKDFWLEPQSFYSFQGSFFQFAAKNIILGYEAMWKLGFELSKHRTRAFGGIGTQATRLSHFERISKLKILPNNSQKDKKNYQQPENWKWKGFRWIFPQA